MALEPSHEPIAVALQMRGASNPLIIALQRRGWRIRPVTNLDDASRARAALWVTDLATPGVLRSLVALQATVSLLVIADQRQLETHHDELIELQRKWPAPMQVLTKPYCEQALRLQVEYLTGSMTSPKRREAGHLVVDTGKRKVWLAGVTMALTRSEFAVLVRLVEAEGDAVPKDTLGRALHADEECDERSLRTHISRLRGKLEAAGAGAGAIQTVYGVGYALEKTALEVRIRTVT